MSPARRTTCRECDGSFPRPGELSKQGYCAECGPLVNLRVIRELQQKDGPAYDKWLASMRKAVGA
jgi:hypothetical protein